MAVLLSQSRKLNKGGGDPNKSAVGDGFFEKKIGGEDAY